MKRCLVLSAWFALLVVVSSAEAQYYSTYRYREQIVVVPRIVNVTPWGYYDLLGGYPRYYPTVPQPTGHRITPTGPNGYVYEPVYNPPPVGVAPGATVVERPVMPGQVVSPPSPPANAKPSPQATAISALVREILMTFRAGRYDDVVAQCEVALIDDPRMGAIHLLQSHALFALQRYDESAGALGRGLSVLDESQWSLLMNERQQFYPVGAYDPMLDKLRQFTAAQPTDAPARVLLGYHLGMLGRIGEAREHLNAARQLDPADELTPRLLRRWASN
ncbi:MAG: tetratricopeptide repeat protein [Planctomycetaceae bacterium]|nr:tetratricopeptide repeat protein [Planctomycetaceae bacterium]